MNLPCVETSIWVKAAQLAIFSIANFGGIHMDMLFFYMVNHKLNV